MNIRDKRFYKRYGKAAEAVARQDIDQEVREVIATALTDAFDREPDFQPELFWLLCADPLSPCVGPAANGLTPCPDGNEVRIGMHLRGAPNGRSAAWAPRRPTVRCVSCGSKLHLQYAEVSV